MGKSVICMTEGQTGYPSHFSISSGHFNIFIKKKKKKKKPRDQNYSSKKLSQKLTTVLL